MAGVFLAVTALLAVTLPLVAFGQDPGTIKIQETAGFTNPNEPAQVCGFWANLIGFTNHANQPVTVNISAHPSGTLVDSKSGTFNGDGNASVGDFSIPNGHYRASVVGTSKTKVFKVQCTTSPALTLTKSAPTTVKRPDNFDYVITVTNNGSAAATAVLIEDQVPSPFTVVTVTPDPATTCDQPAASVSCTFATVAPSGGIAKVTINVNVPAGVACDPVTNAATVKMDGDSDVVALDSATTRPTGCAPVLELSKTADPPNPLRGTQIEYEITVQNTGDDDAEDVVIVDTLPPAYDLVLPLPASCSESTPGEVTCTLGTIAPTGSESVTLTVVVPLGAACTQSTNSVTVDSSSAPKTIVGSPATATTTPTGCPTGGGPTLSPDLSIDKSAPASAELGESFDYTLTLTNTGTATATGVTVTDVVPAPFEAGAAPQGCTVSGNTVTCAGLSVPTGTGNAVTITIPVTVPEDADCGPVTNTASYTSTNAGSGSDSATTEVTGCVDVLGNGHLEVRTVVVGDPPANASFAYEAECGAFSLGPAGSFSMGAAGGTHGVGIGIPDGTVCTVTQTDDGGADEVTVSVSRRPGGVVGAAAVNAAATILENTTAVVTFTNVFFETQVAGPGTLVVRKDVSGTPATGAEYVFEASCDGFALGQAGRFTLPAAGGSHEVGVGIPDGTRCTVTETTNGGADSTTVSVDGGAAASGAIATVDIAEDTTTTVGFTNTFAAQAAPGTIRTPTRVDAGGGGTAPDVPPLGAALVAIALAAAVTMGQLGLRLVSRLGGGAARR